MYEEPEFLIDPYIPRKGIVLLWGDTSIGKSPLTWHMARSTGSGESFFGLPTTKSRTLYLEVDTPEQSLVPRLKKIAPAPAGVWWEFLPSLSIPMASEEHRELLRSSQVEVNPELVFINTLRKVHDLDDKDSATPKIVYSFFQRAFPNAALVFIHHARKRPVDPRFTENDKESFSGAKNWLNDAQVGLHLETFTSQKESLRLYHRKSQVSDLLRPLPLKLWEDGTTLTCPLAEELRIAQKVMQSNRETPKDILDAMIAKEIGTALGTAKRRRLTVLSGDWPRSRAFLAREKGVDDLENG